MKTGQTNQPISIIKTVLLLFLLTINTYSFGTVSSYTFSSSAGNYVPITGTSLYTSTWDDGASALLTIPFTFNYNNISFTTLSVTPNGFITLGSIPSGTIYCGLQSASTPANSIAGYGTDLIGASITSSIQYTTLGTTPNRKFIIQWADCDHYGTGSVNHLNFQIVLNETSNTVQVIFGTFTAVSTFGANTCSDASTESGSVGLRGGNATDFNVRKVLNGTSTWAASTTGTLISDVCNFSPTNLPVAGLTYTWTPAPATVMSFVSSTTSLLNNGMGISHPSVNNQILQIQVVTTGSLTPFSVTSINLSTNGTTSPLVDLINAKVYFTGPSSSFSSTTQFGSTVVSPNGSFTIPGSVTLSEGTNYFWLSYDVAAGAQSGDHISGCCNSITGSGTMGLRTPTVTCPAGFQLITQLGTWSAVNTVAPHPNGGVMLLMSDGTVICKSTAGGASYGNIFDKLTPDVNGSYANGTWTSIAPMINTRLYFSSQILRDGRVYVAGGEYGTGLAAGEVYNPLTNTWTLTPAPGANVSDANSEMLPDGRVLQALVAGSLTSTLIYNPITNTYINGPTALGIHNESAWVKLPDNSILYVNRLATSSERYIPATNTWVNDGTVPVSLYDAFGLETGGAVILPDGRAFFIGSTGHTALYTPTGTTSPGTWVAGPDLPNLQGAPDAPMAMMVNGKVLCAVSPLPTSANHFPPPTSFYEYDYITNTFTQLNAPGGGSTINMACYLANMLALPDGNILYSAQGASQYYIYTPSGSQLASGAPTVSTLYPISCTDYQITGTKFNGISQGANYGDDWQMSTNYPVIRLKSGSNVYYVRTYNWNSTGVMRGNAPDTTYFTLPAGLPQGTYSLEVTANGISSAPYSFNTTSSASVSIASSAGTSICTGINTTITAIAINGGSAPTYQWIKNTTNIGTGNSISTSAIANADSIKCIMTSNSACLTAGTNPATSNTLVFTSSYCTEDVNAKVFIQGFYIPGGDSMMAVLDPINLPTITDSITVQLADSVTHNIAASDKKRINTHGNGIFHFTGLIPGHRYYIIFKGRNSIETWSKYTYLFNTPTLTIDMTH